MPVNEAASNGQYPIVGDIWNVETVQGDLPAGEFYIFEYFGVPRSESHISKMSVDDLEELDSRRFEDLVRAVLDALPNFPIDRQVKILTEMSSLRSVLDVAMEQLGNITSRLHESINEDLDYLYSQFAGTFFFATESVRRFAELLIYEDVVEVDPEAWEEYESILEYVNEHPPEDEWLERLRDQVRNPPNVVEDRTHYIELRNISYGLLVNFLVKSGISAFSLYAYWSAFWTRQQQEFSVYYPIRDVGR